MALTAFQRTICRRLADRRVARGDRYVAGGVALSVALEPQRGDPRELSETLARGGLQFHAGRIGGALPRIIR